MDYRLQDLYGNEFQIGMFDWLAMLDLAKRNGWKPRGTIPPQWYRGRIVDLGYASNDGQYVTYEDAIEFGKALKLGMENLRPTIGDPAITYITTSGFDGLTLDRVIEELKANGVIFFVDGDGVVSGNLRGDWYFSGRGRQKLEKVIELCKSSGFLIQSEGLCGFNSWETNLSSEDPF